MEIYSKIEISKYVDSDGFERIYVAVHSSNNTVLESHSIRSYDDFDFAAELTMNLANSIRAFKKNVPLVDPHSETHFFDK